MSRSNAKARVKVTTAWWWLLSAFFANSIHAEVVAQESRSLEAVYPDGKSERIVVRYEAHANHSQRTLGNASKPLTGRLIDTRHCVWEINTFVTRRAYVLTHSGLSAPIGESVKTWTAQKNDRRGPRNIVQAAGYHQTCGDVQGLINQQLANAKTDILNAFAAIVSSDASSVEKELIESLKPKSIRRAPDASK